MKTSIINVHDLLSVFSVDEVEKRIGEVPGVESVTVNFAAGNATVRYDETHIDAADIKSVVRQKSYESDAPESSAVKPTEDKAKAPATPPVVKPPEEKGKTETKPTAKVENPDGPPPTSTTVKPPEEKAKAPDVKPPEEKDKTETKPPASDKKEEDHAGHKMDEMSKDKT